jgi:predicted CXXCH cytochrome family protein
MEHCAAAVIALSLLAASGCAEAARPAARSTDLPLPAAKKDCGACHTAAAPAAGNAALRKTLSDLCTDCHRDRMPPNEHRVDIVPAMPVKDLPLADGGMMTCFTCHDPHRNPYGGLLRKPETALCLSCHPY